MAGSMLLAAAGAAAALFFPLPSLQQGGPGASGVDVLQGDEDAYSRLTMPVQIGTSGPFDFLIDTGSERTVLSRDVASRLGLVPNGAILLTGIAGSMVVQTVDVGAIDYGRRRFHGLSAPLLEGHFLRADGIIGLDGLQDQRVLLDFRNNRIAIDNARQLGGNSGYEVTLSARRRANQLIIGNALVDGVRTDVVIDTGSQTSIGNRALQRRLANRHHGEPVTIISVTGQEMIADSGYVGTLTFQRMVLRNNRIAFADAAPFERLGLTRRPALLLGMEQLRLFDRVAIDFSTGKVLFDLPERHKSVFDPMF